MARDFLHVTDVHLDHLSPLELKEFFKKVNEASTFETIMLVTGDITTARRLYEHIDGLGQACRGKMLYVLGNHDRWAGSLANCERDLRLHNRVDGHSVFMDVVDRVQLDVKTCVVGDSGWYDGRNGLQGNPQMILNDWFYVEEYRGKDPRKCSAEIADKRARILEAKLRAAVAAGNERVVVLTHVPPFVESAKHMGRPSDDYALPWFSSQVIGDAIDQVAKEFFYVKFEVLAGHTHSKCSYMRDDNLNVTVGAADYGNPRVDPWKPTLW
jgi:predicted phosphohydrolase